MGNCFTSRRAKVAQDVNDDHKKKSQNHSGVPKNINRNSQGSAPSSPELKSNRESGAQRLPTPRSEGKLLSSSDAKAFTFADLKEATRNFKPENFLGQGGFGHVFKGWVNPSTLGPARPGSGMVIAVKKLNPEGLQGHKQWLTEVNHLGRLRHPNLVKLFGYCLDGENQLLVYEFMPKGSLENHLFRNGPKTLSWELRIKVAIGAARGLSFLHESRVIYRDLKTSNILLDADFNAKLSDFGLAKEGPTGDKSHVSTQVLGTEGYAAPEYIATGHLTEKSDVYAFGVVLLEILTGRHALDKSKVGIEQFLVEWARPYIGDKRKLFRIMDTKLEGQYSQKGAYMAAVVALQCLRTKATSRPTMPEVIASLEQAQAPRESASSISKSPVRSSPPPSNLTPTGSPLHSDVPSPLHGA